ncbi:hypothetical protein LCGC14_3153650, partial [marine sediment metagenome]
RGQPGNYLTVAYHFDPLLTVDGHYIINNTE